MEKELNIAAILKEKPKGIKLYSVTFGDCTFTGVTGNDNISLLYLQDSPFFTDEYGKYDEKGECLIFPSRNMRDWSKFAWKKGDVLKVATGSDCSCIFDRFTNDDYTEFTGVFDKYLDRFDYFATSDWCKVTDEKEYESIIQRIETQYGGKLNLDTLRIEKHQFKDGDILYIEVGLYRSKYILIYCKDNEVFIPTYYCFLNLASRRHDDIFKVRNSPLPFSIICDEGDIMVVRLSTDSEKQQLFSALEKEGKAWDADKKQIVDLPKKCEFKPMDWCLMRMHRCIWRLCQYSSDYNGKDSSCRYIAVGGNAYEECIPYNDQTAHLLGTTDDWEGGEE